VSSRVPSGSRSWRSSPSTMLRVPPMEVERFKHRQLAPTVGPSSRSSGEFEGPLVIKNQSFEADGQDRVHPEIPRRLVESLRTRSQRFQLRLIRRSIKSEAYQKLIRVRSWCTTRDWKQFTCSCPHQARDVGIKSKSGMQSATSVFVQAWLCLAREDLLKLIRVRSWFACNLLNLAMPCT
jgi:hypothetical protein